MCNVGRQRIWRGEEMKKTLILVDNLDEFICKESNTIHLDAGMILTAGAKDELTRRHVSIVRGAAPERDCGRRACVVRACVAAAANPHADVERLVHDVAATLQKEYGITDPAELKAASLKAVETIRKNL